MKHQAKPKDNYTQTNQTQSNNQANTTHNQNQATPIKTRKIKQQLNKHTAKTKHNACGNQIQT